MTFPFTALSPSADEEDIVPAPKGIPGPRGGGCRSLLASASVELSSSEPGTLADNLDLTRAAVDLGGKAKDVCFALCASSISSGGCSLWIVPLSRTGDGDVEGGSEDGGLGVFLRDGI